MHMPASADSLYIGIDLGTSGARAIAIANDGTPHGDGKCTLPESDRRSPAMWWQVVSSALDSLLDKIDRTQVTAIAIDATSGTVLAVDPTGTPLSDALMYNDAIDSEEVLSAIANTAPATSAVHGASSALARAITLQNNARLQNKATGKTKLSIVHQADWLAGKLGGQYHISDESNALKTGYNPVNRHWPAWIASTGLNPACLPEVVPCGTITGPISADSALRFQLPASTALVTGATDGCASFLATGAGNIGDCVTALGTTITMKMLCDKPLFEPKYGIYSHRIGDMWLAGGASNSGGNVLAAHFSIEQIEAYSRQVDTANSPELGYYPLLKKGERFPHNDADWPPRMTPRPESDVTFLQAILEGMADIEALGYLRLQELGAPAPASMRTVGGGAHNSAWTALRQARLNTTFATSNSDEAAVGVATLARQAIRNSAA